MSFTSDFNGLRNDRHLDGRITPSRRGSADRYEDASQGSEHGTDGSLGFIGSSGSGIDDLPARSSNNKSVAALAKLREKQQRVVQALRTNASGSLSQPLGIGSRQVSFSEAQPSLVRQFTEGSMDGAGSTAIDPYSGMSAVGSPVTADTEIMKLLSEVKESQDTLFQALKDQEQRLGKNLIDLQGTIQDGERRQSAIQGSVESQSTRLDLLSTKVASQHHEHLEELNRLRGSVATQADSSKLREEIAGLRAQQAALEQQNQSFSQIWIKEKEKLEAEVARLTERNSQLVQQIQAAIQSSEQGAEASLDKRRSTSRSSQFALPKSWCSSLRIAALVSSMVAILGLAGSVHHGAARSTPSRTSSKKSRAAIIFGYGLRTRPQAVP